MTSNASNVDPVIDACLDYLHPRIRKASVKDFRQGSYANAAELAIRAVYAYIKERTGLPDDGAKLVQRAFSEHKPILAFGDLNDPTTKDRQVGFMELLAALYKGVRNPFAHHGVRIDGQTAAYEYLVLASWCCRRIDEASSAWFIHPSGDRTRRETVTPCRFEINARYNQSGNRRWSTYADVLVQLRAGGPPNVDTRFVYLIPSGRAPDAYSKPDFWRGDPRALKEKHEAVEAFVRANLGKELEGGCFLQRKREESMLAVYCREFDEHLQAAYKQGLSQIPGQP